MSNANDEFERAFGGAAGGQGSLVSSPVQISVSCKELANMDTLSKSDPFVILYVPKIPWHQQKSTSPFSSPEQLPQSDWVEVARTEVIPNELNPVFQKKFSIVFHFEETQPLRFFVMDQDKNKDEFIGEATLTLANIVGAPASKASVSLRNNRKNNQVGSLIVYAEEVSSEGDTAKATVSLHGACDHLEKKDLFGKSDPHFWISRVRDDGTLDTVYKSEVIKKTLSPVFKPLTEFPVEKMCLGDMSKPLQIDVWDWNSSGKDDHIGCCKTSLAEMLQKGKLATYDLINPEYIKKKKKNYKNSGYFIVKTIDLAKQHSFFDYIHSGLEMRLEIGIDFTASNGNPNSQSSLHFVSPQNANEYIKAIASVGHILSAYDTDGMIPTWIFGARGCPGVSGTSHCFPCNLQKEQPECAGIQGVINAYGAALQRVSLSGPTNFAPMINTVAERCRSSKDSAYTILLILTDGEITDMDRTIDAIIDASSLPLSIIIVGVGFEKFEKMVELDSDDELLPSKTRKGVRAHRDIVQFVPFAKYANKNFNELAKEVLYEVPGQLLAYMREHKIAPQPRTQEYYMQAQPFAIAPQQQLQFGPPMNQ